MQRRVAAIYFVFFLVMGASAYSVIALAEEPAVDLEGDSYQEGDEFTVDGREYVVANLTNQSSGGDGGGHGGGGGGEEQVGRLEWTNESAQHTATLANNSSYPPARASFPGQRARYTATLAEGDTVTYNGSEATVSIPDTESPENFSLVRDGNETATAERNGTFSYRGNETTVAEITADEVTLIWGDDYRVLVPNESDPSSFRMVQQFNVSRRLAADPAVDNETVTREDGQEYVVYRENGTTRPLGAYLPDPDVAEIEEGDTMAFGLNETTVANVTSEEVVLEWTAPEVETIDLTEGANVTLNDQQYVVHFRGDSVQISPQVEKYQQDRRAQEYFHERQNGLWGVTLLSGITAMFIIGLAYLPVRG